MLHTIVDNSQKNFEQVLKSGGWMYLYIFPGALLPTVEVVQKKAKKMD